MAKFPEFQAMGRIWKEEELRLAREKLESEERYKRDTAALIGRSTHEDAVLEILCYAERVYGGNDMDATTIIDFIRACVKALDETLRSERLLAVFNGDW